MKLVYVLFIVFSGIVFAQESKLENKFGSYSHSLDSTTIPYRLFIPEQTGTKTPLVIALHGAGERGNDNKKHIEFHGLATVWVDSLNQKEHPCFVVAPQCPEGEKWVDINWGSEYYDFQNTPISNELATVVDLIDSLLEKYPIDENRIYVTGLSMGGFGSWYLLMNNPNRFAAAIIMSGAADPQMALEIVEIPIWNFHGDVDKAVPVEGSRNMMKAFSDYGINVLMVPNPNDISVLENNSEKENILSSNHIYTEYAGKGHVVWKESYNNSLVREWIFSKRIKNRH